MHDEERFGHVADVLQQTFGSTQPEAAVGTITVRVDGQPAVVDVLSGVRCSAVVCVRLTIGAGGGVSRCGCERGCAGCRQQSAPVIAPHCSADIGRAPRRRWNCGNAPYGLVGIDILVHVMVCKYTPDEKNTRRNP